MTNTFEERKAEFKRECRQINLRFEYPDYVGKERYAIVTSLSEEELIEKYGDVIKRYYAPYLLLNEEQGKVIVEFQNLEAKSRMRNLRFGHAFDINDGEFEEHHPEFAVEENYAELIDLNDKVDVLRVAMTSLKETQKRRIIKYFFYGKSCPQIAKEEGVSHTAIKESIDAGIKKLKNFF